MRLPLLLLALAALPACSSSELSSQEENLREARAAWAEAGVADYRLTYRESCFCPSERTTVVVRGGAVDAVYVGDEGAETAVAFDPDRHWDVPALFGYVEAALDRDPDEAVVAYDPALGYPTSARFDYERGAVDEEDGFTVSAFERL